MSADDPSRDATTSADASAPIGPGASGSSRGRRLVLRLAGVFAVLAVLLALAIGALVWSVHQAAASAWLLGFVPGLTVIEPKGALVGDFAATRIVYVVGGTGELRLESPRWRALAATRGDRGRWLHLVIDSLHADRVVWVASKAPGPADAATLPQSLRLPVEIEVREASVDELRIGSAEAMPVRNVRARVHLGA
ncbi:MAG: hypothetical protein M3Z15_01520, partial [Pseudomonadota bacterium]|nr:hypothetical protein [Pseudomonadota bacterium]